MQQACALQVLCSKHVLCRCCAASMCSAGVVQQACALQVLRSKHVLCRCCAANMCSAGVLRQACALHLLCSKHVLCRCCAASMCSAGVVQQACAAIFRVAAASGPGNSAQLQDASTLPLMQLAQPVLIAVLYATPGCGRTLSSPACFRWRSPSVVQQGPQPVPLTRA